MSIQVWTLSCAEQHGLVCDQQCIQCAKLAKASYMRLLQHLQLCCMPQDQEALKVPGKRRLHVSCKLRFLVNAQQMGVEGCCRDEKGKGQPQGAQKASGL